ncbi:MAG: hypothetical protein HOW97_39855 [Catenulispora sp.]|nr:hypothetical protein [Catenulispora sp.]NUS29183.1 hypothetical protein [Streptomyces sp.]
MSLAIPTLASEIPGNYVTSALWNANVYNGITYLLTPPLYAGYQSAAQSIANTSLTAITMDSSVVDSYGGHSSITNNTRYTAQVGGYYLVIGQVGYAANASGNRLIELHKNGGGTLALGQGVGLAPTTANNGAVQVTALVLLSAGDYVEAYTYQTSGGSLSTIPSQTGMTVLWLHA